MVRLAADRGQTFRVVIVPSAGEIRAGRHARLCEEYISHLSAKGIPVTLVIEVLSPNDYHRHNMHLTQRGAEVVARGILDALGTP
jgi:hypothetical protein